MSDIADEAKELLLGIHTCESCGREATEYEPNPVTFEEDPYQSDINGDHTLVWECATCRQSSADSI